MKIRCKYCENYISETEEVCPNCGAVNQNLKRTGNGVPTTIEELKQWYIDHNLPDENITRFFIGKDYKEPKAFGIYYDAFTENYIVYKNKDTGQRVIRYEGKDQTYAVNELYLKLKEEIQNQKNRNSMKSYNDNPDLNNNSVMSGPLFFLHFFSVFVSFILIRYNWIAPIFLFLSLNPVIFIMIPILSAIKDKRKAKIVENTWHIISFIIFILLLIIPPTINKYNHRNDAYYKNNDGYYYNYGGNWYYYDKKDKAWNNYEGNISDLKYVGDTYSIFYNITDFEDSIYYGKNEFWSSSWDSRGSPDSSSSGGSTSSDWNDTWDSSSTWDSNDTWDSDGTDWSSNW